MQNQPQKKNSYFFANNKKSDDFQNDMQQKQQPFTFTEQQKSSITLNFHQKRLNHVIMGKQNSQSFDFNEENQRQYTESTNIDCDSEFKFKKSEAKYDQKQQNNQEIINSLLKKPTQFRSNIILNFKETIMNQDYDNYFQKNQKVDEIMYHIQYNSYKQTQLSNRECYVYYFSIKQLVPQSQLKDYQIWLTNEFQKLLLQAKASNNRLEIYLEPIPMIENRQFKKVITYLWLGKQMGKINIQYSNTVPIELLMSSV